MFIKIFIDIAFKIPIRVLKSCLMPLDLNENTTLDVSPPTKDEYTIVWIEKRV